MPASAGSHDDGLPLLLAAVGLAILTGACAVLLRRVRRLHGGYDGGRAA
ncbi:MAG: hypothetical protein WAL63_17000 [Solirubrobacteraceae bacterium]